MTLHMSGNESPRQKLVVTGMMLIIINLVELSHRLLVTKICFPDYTSASFAVRCGHVIMF